MRFCRRSRRRRIRGGKSVSIQLCRGCGRPSLSHGERRNDLLSAASGAKGQWRKRAENIAREGNFNDRRYPNDGSNRATDTSPSLALLYQLVIFHDGGTVGSESLTDFSAPPRSPSRISASRIFRSPCRVRRRVRWRVRFDDAHDAKRRGV